MIVLNWTRTLYELPIAYLTADIKTVQHRAAHYQNGTFRLYDGHFVRYVAFRVLTTKRWWVKISNLVSFRVRLCVFFLNRTAFFVTKSVILRFCALFGRRLVDIISAIECLERLVDEMACNVSSWTLNSTYSLTPADS